MTWFRPKLEPEERVVLRQPSLLWQFLFTVGWGTMLIIPWLGVGLYNDAPLLDGQQDWAELGFRAGVGAILGGLYFIKYRWQFIVTNRRLLNRTGWLRQKLVSLPLDRISGLRYSETGLGLEVLCGDEAHAIDPGFLEYHRIHKALGLPEEHGRIYETKLKKILAPGETVIAREPGSCRNWRWVVTDRRILHRAAPVEEMKLEDIKDIEQQAYVPKVTLRGGGRQVTIQCFDDEARRLVRSLGREPVEVLV